MGPRHGDVTPHRLPPPDAHFDAVIVGSGFGGSVMTYRLAEAGLSVCLLERGKAYPPGSFPRSPWETGRNFWDRVIGALGLLAAAYGVFACGSRTPAAHLILLSVPALFAMRRRSGILARMQASYK